MAIVKMELIAEHSRPAIQVETALSTSSALIDTGAYFPMYFGSRDAFQMEFPSAIETEYAAYIGGLGGNDKTPCPVYEIEQFAFSDMENPLEQFILKKVPFAILDPEKHQKKGIGYSMLLPATFFSMVDLSLMNRNKPRYVQIEADRECYCTVILRKDEKGLPVKDIEDHIVVSGLSVYLQEMRG